jgi:hypothetical protein
MSERKYNEAEIREAVAKYVTEIRPGAMGGAKHLADQILSRTPYAEARGWEAGDVFTDADGHFFEFFPADYCEEGDPPTFNEFGCMHTVPFDAPQRPLTRVYPEIVQVLANFIHQYDAQESGYGAYDVVGELRDLVDDLSK